MRSNHVISPLDSYHAENETVARQLVRKYAVSSDWSTDDDELQLEKRHHFKPKKYQVWFYRLHSQSIVYYTT